MKLCLDCRKSAEASCFAAGHRTIGSIDLLNKYLDIEEDWTEAAGELNIPIELAPKGSVVRKLLIANSILRQKVSHLQNEIGEESGRGRV